MITPRVRQDGVTAGLAALAILAFTSCTETPASMTEPLAVAAARVDAGSPQVFAPGTISDAREQYRITFTPNGRTAYFAASDVFFPFSRQATIYVSHYHEGDWSVPEVASFSGVFSDIDPALSPDGGRLYFSSIRPVDGQPRTDIDLWMVERTEHGWSEPVNLGPNVNSSADELYPSVTASGTLYFASGPPFPQPGAHFDIFSAQRDGDGFGPRAALGPAVNTSPVPGGGLQDAWEFNPEISPDGHRLVFTSLRPGGYGLGDLYISHMHNGEWSQARNLGPVVNTAADEFHPTVSRNGLELFFVRRIPRRGDFYSVDTRSLDTFRR